MVRFIESVKETAIIKQAKQIESLQAEVERLKACGGDARNELRQEEIDQLREQLAEMTRVRAQLELDLQRAETRHSDLLNLYGCHDTASMICYINTLQKISNRHTAGKGLK